VGKSCQRSAFSNQLLKHRVELVFPGCYKRLGKQHLSVLLLERFRFLGSDIVNEQASELDSNDSTSQTQPNLNSASATEPSSETPTAIPVNDADATTSYANFYRVTSNPEELVLDFGLNRQAYGNSQVSVDISQRIVLNHYTAKRVAGALVEALRRHEQAFGPIELDARKRVKPS